MSFHCFHLFHLTFHSRNYLILKELAVKSEIGESKIDKTISQIQFKIFWQKTFKKCFHSFHPIEITQCNTEHYQGESSGERV